MPLRPTAFERGASIGEAFQQGFLNSLSRAAVLQAEEDERERRDASIRKGVGFLGQSMGQGDVLDQFGRENIDSGNAPLLVQAMMGEQQRRDLASARRFDQQDAEREHGRDMELVALRAILDRESLGLQHGFNLERDRARAGFDIARSLLEGSGSGGDMDAADLSLIYNRTSSERTRVRDRMMDNLAALPEEVRKRFRSSGQKGFFGTGIGEDPVPDTQILGRLNRILGGSTISMDGLDNLGELVGDDPAIADALAPIIEDIRGLRRLDDRLLALTSRAGVSPVSFSDGVTEHDDQVLRESLARLEQIGQFPVEQPVLGPEPPLGLEAQLAEEERQRFLASRGGYVSGGSR